MLHKIFTIGNEIMDGAVLLLEIGEDYCSYAVLKEEERAFCQISYITYDELQMQNDLARVLDELKNISFKKLIVCSALPQSLLIPSQFSKEAHSFVSSVYDAPFQKQFTNDIPEWQMTVAYSLPASVFNLIAERFSSVQYVHAYIPLLKIYNGYTAPDQIDIHFSTQHFRVLVKKNKQVQLAQTYSYKTPLDVTYYLLKICYEFQLNQSEVFIVISGLIDEDSALYNELHNYFLNLHFAQAPSYSLPENDYPHHYFSSLYNLAACVS